MDRFPDSLIAFQRMFPHDDACAAWLASVRWPEGFSVMITLGATRQGPHVECARCHRQTSVTAGTILHGSKLALTVWFWAAYLMAARDRGAAAPEPARDRFLSQRLAACAKPWSIPSATRCRASSRSTRPRWRSAPRMIPWPAAPGAATTASCSSSAPRGRRRQRAGPPAPGRDRVLRRRKPQPLHRPQHRRRQHRQDRRLGRLRRGVGVEALAGLGARRQRHRGGVPKSVESSRQDIPDIFAPTEQSISKTARVPSGKVVSPGAE